MASYKREDLLDKLKYNELYLIFHDDITQHKYNQFKLNNVSRQANLLFSGIVSLLYLKYTIECIPTATTSSFSCIVMLCRIVKFLICLIWYLMFLSKHYLKINYPLFVNNLTVLH
jgi:hypothetical protein